jgi:hypothetical protein
VLVPRWRARTLGRSRTERPAPLIGARAVTAFERHFSINELAKFWGFSVGAVRALFRDRSDVLRIGHGETRTKRAYLTLRIPESIAQRVYAELRQKRAATMRPAAQHRATKAKVAA